LLFTLLDPWFVPCLLVPSLVSSLVPSSPILLSLCSSSFSWQEVVPIVVPKVVVVGSLPRGCSWMYRIQLIFFMDNTLLDVQVEIELGETET